MKIVRSTNPPSMAVIVDTILQGEQTLILAPSHWKDNRIDAIYVEHGALKLYTGVLAPQPMAPKLQGRRLLATIYIPYLANSIFPHMITELA